LNGVAVTLMALQVMGGEDHYGHPLFIESLRASRPRYPRLFLPTVNVTATLSTSVSADRQCPGHAIHVCFCRPSMSRPRYPRLFLPTVNVTATLATSVSADRQCHCNAINVCFCRPATSVDGVPATAWPANRFCRPQRHHRHHLTKRPIGCPPQGTSESLSTPASRWRTSSPCARRCARRILG
jgi:hypothetical protein